MERRNILKLIGSCMAAPLAGNVFAQQAYPSHPMRIVVASGPTSPTDFAGRIVADLLNRRYGQPVTVENRPGAGGMIGLQHAAQAEPDGYTLATGGLGNHVIPPIVIKNLPFDVIKSLTAPFPGSSGSSRNRARRSPCARRP